MKTLKIALLPLLIATSLQTAQADPIPFGCYVTDEERNWFRDNCGIGQGPSCYTSSDGNYSWLTPGNTSIQGLINAYGDPVATFIKIGYEAALAGYQVEAAYKAKVSLEKKLRRVCGSKCRRVK